MERAMSTPPTGPQHLSLNNPRCQFAEREACVGPYLFASDGLPKIPGCWDGKAAMHRLLPRAEPFLLQPEIPARH